MKMLIAGCVMYQISVLLGLKPELAFLLLLLAWLVSWGAKKL